MWTFPQFGTWLLYGVMLVASYTFAISLAAGANGRPRTLQAARLGAYGTVTLILSAVLCLAYAFVSHDFRIRYVAHYSDRSMSLWYLLTALWGGQDGSLLWWTFLLSLYIGACVKWMGHRYVQLQPYVIATLMSVVLFFCVLMTFSANPFATSLAGAKTDGEGLNPLLQNFYMIIHPPSLYTGFVGCSVPFAFAMAALATGRLDNEWLGACRKWALFALMFLGIGNVLGMLWAYEELGWGGYWAWDPVENAAFMPLLSMSAFVHSTMIEERRGMLKVWNVALVCLTFFMTILGTFLTRSGMIASVHSFAQSSIGIYFLWYLVVIFVVCATMILYRWPELRGLTPSPRLRSAMVATGWTLLLFFGPGLFFVYRLPLSLPVRVTAMAVVAGVGTFAGIELVLRRMTQGMKLVARRPSFESMLSREFTFLLNNWGLLSFMVFVLMATLFPLISEKLWDEKVTVGPPYYNAWVQPLGLIIYALMGMGTLFGWKKTSPDALKKAFLVPVSAGVLVAVLQFAVGSKLGYPAVVWSDPLYEGALGKGLQVFNAFTPVLGFSLSAFNFAVIAQEFYMLFRARKRSGASKGTPAILYYLGFVPGFFHTLVTLSPAARRRYGGYVVHLGIVLMFVGFTGKSWTIDKETTLSPGQTYQVDKYTLEYVGPRMEVDNSKRMVFADVRVIEDGKTRDQLSPAKFIYKRMPESPTTEVAMLHSLRDDLYLVVGSINPQTKIASLQIHVNPLVVWIWLGGFLLIAGSIVCLWPELAPEESRAWAFARGSAAVAASVTIGLTIAILPAKAYGQASSSLHAGTVEIKDPKERAVFSSIRCMCGDCQRLPLTSCACSWADDARADIRAKLAAGMTKDEIVAGYLEAYGSSTTTSPPDKGGFRAIYIVPLTAIGLAAIGLGVMAQRWRKQSLIEPAPAAAGASPATANTTSNKDEYDARLDEELRDLDV